jgi:hypothetical protein
MMTSGAKQYSPVWNTIWWSAGAGTNYLLLIPSVQRWQTFVSSFSSVLDAEIQKFRKETTMLRKNTGHYLVHSQGFVFPTPTLGQHAEVSGKCRMERRSFNEIKAQLACSMFIHLAAAAMISARVQSMLPANEVIISSGSGRKSYREQLRPFPTIQPRQRQIWVGRPVGAFPKASLSLRP